MSRDPGTLARAFFAAAPRYEPRGVLGSGRSGTVFEAWDLELDAEVAVKVVWAHGPAGDAAGEAMQRLKAEVVVNRRLSHPSIVRVFDVAEAAGLPYLTRELVHGTDLGLFSGGRGIPVPEAAGLLRQVAGACRAAHGAGVVHGALTPQRVLVQPDCRAVVLDFGRTVPGTTWTGAGAAYLAPEQVRGEAWDASADLYALGAIAHELLTGAPPLSAEEAVRLAFSGAPAGPGLEPLRSRGVPEELAAVIGRCLSPEPERRPAGTGALLAVLDGTPSGEEAAAAGTRARHVLVVDDDRIVRMVLRRLVGATGAEVSEASNGEEALRALSARPADLVLLDLVMPVLDGFDTLRVIRSTPDLSRTPVVLVSAHDDRQRRAFGTHAGASGFLQKPLDLAVVRRVVERWLA